MTQIQPGTRLGVGKPLMAKTFVHLYDMSVENIGSSFCGEGFESTSIVYANALNKREFIYDGHIIPVATNIACSKCAEIYKSRVDE